MGADTQEEARAVAARTTTAPNEILMLRLGAEEYGIDILRVQEIRSYEAPTRIANAPGYILGVTNLRGVIVPIVDLRCRLGLQAAYDAGTVTVVLNISGRTLGAVDARHITGIGTLDHDDAARLLILLDIEQLMSGAEMGLVADPIH